MLSIQEKQAIKCTLELLTSEMTRNKKLLIKAVITDSDGSHAEAVWFNQRIILSKFAKWDAILLYGKPKYEYGRLSFPSAEIEHFSPKRQEIMPVYSDVNYIPGTWIREKMAYMKPFLAEISEVIPESIREKRKHKRRNENVRSIHFPLSIEDFERAKRELGYEELYQFQLIWVEKKYSARTSSEGLAPPIPLDTDLIKSIIADLPFSLTDKQKIVLFQILKDMEKPHSMARLLQWDVGTGKTIVALIASIHAIIISRKNNSRHREERSDPENWNMDCHVDFSQEQKNLLAMTNTWIQVAIMAPTEILARQHFAGSEAWLMKWWIRSDLLVGSLTPRMKEDARERLKSGQTDIIFGTHALIQDSVQFHSLGFVVVDEQHRFWVEQRKILEEYCSRNLLEKGGGLSETRDGGLESQEKQHIEFRSDLEEKAKELRKEMTWPEKNIWYNLLRRDKLSWFRFLRQKPLLDYIVDFYCHELRLAIEIDGESHIGNEEYDKSRTCALEKEWIVVIRFLNDEATKNLEWVYANLLKTITEIQKHQSSVSPSVRQLLSQGALVPHRLNMSATPIPRTLALTIYGDQDVSVLDEYPAGRKPIHTRVLREDQRVEAYRFIEEEVRQGRQVYWISPLVQESETLEIASAVEMQITLSSVFPKLTIGLIHGKMSGKEKDRIMQEFYENKIHILSSTSVVEVWVDNPNATVMCIEAAERFWLSQLHQFRGRVGRGDDQSYCYLFTTKEYKTKRLRAMEKTGDGFELAEIDLELRGPGEVYGVRQSWVPDFHFADLRDVGLISEIREDIEEWITWRK